MNTLAQELAVLVKSVIGADLPIRLIAWDGSETGPPDGPVLVIADRTALRRLVWQPNELGMAQAYILGEVDVIGDMGEALSRVWQIARAHKLAGVKVGRQARLKAARIAARHGAFGPRPAAPKLQAALEGRQHSRERDRAAIGYHYDLSNEFYELLLDPHMAYSCAYWTRTSDPLYTLADAQRDKLNLICAKLGLRPGMRLLDVGCGWGALALHAATAFGAQVVGVTLSAHQHDYATRRVAENGLSELVEIRLMDYRDLTDGPYDAIAAIEMGEHVGAQGYPAFARRLHDLLTPGGRLLVQQMSRGRTAPGGGAFIESYIAPDMHMRPVGQTIGLLEQAGLEVRHVQAMREHYVRTVEVWLFTLERRWEQAVELIGESTARVWRLYLIGGALAFAQRRMGVDQILAVRATDNGASQMPLTDDWEATDARR